MSSEPSITNPDCLPLDVLGSRIDVSRCPAEDPVTCADCWGDKSVRILIAGAGGIGCELIHLVAVSGFTNIDIIDLDIVDVTNLNRQFLFRESDIGKYKAEAAASRIRARFPHITVTAHCGKIQEKEISFYQQFAFFLVGVDNVEARRWMNAMAASLIKWELNTEYHGNEAAQKEAKDAIDKKVGLAFCGLETMSASDVPFRTLSYQYAEDTAPAPLIDCGSEAVKGHSKTVIHGKSECIDCDGGIFSRSKVVPMCTLESVPRTAEHCVLYVQQRTWQDMNPFKVPGTIETTKLDGDDHDHIAWVAEHARARQAKFSIPGDIDFTFTQGVVKNSIPTIGFTNAMTASVAVCEMIKMLTGMGIVGPGMITFDGKRGLGWTSVPAIPSQTCDICMPLRHISIDLSTASVADCLIALQNHPDVQAQIVAAYDGKKPPFGMTGVHSTHPNATTSPFILVGEEGSTVKVNLTKEVLQRRDNPFSILMDLKMYMTSYSPSIPSITNDSGNVATESEEVRKRLEGCYMSEFVVGSGENKEVFRPSAIEFATPSLSVGCAGQAETIKVHVI